MCIRLAGNCDHGPLSGSQLKGNRYDGSRVGSGLGASSPCPAGVRRQPRCVPHADLKTRTLKGMGLGHQSFPGTGAAIRHNLQRRLSVQKVRSTVAAMVEKARVDV